VSPVRTLMDGLVKGDAHAAGHVGDAGERRAQVALDIDGQGLERRDVDDAAACLCSVVRRLEHEAVEAPEECGKGFAGAGGG
jgi:hypothetical protein